MRYFLNSFPRAAADETLLRRIKILTNHQKVPTPLSSIISIFTAHGIGQSGFCHLSTALTHLPHLSTRVVTFGVRKSLGIAYAKSSVILGPSLYRRIATDAVNGKGEEGDHHCHRDKHGYKGHLMALREHHEFSSL